MTPVCTNPRVGFGTKPEPGTCSGGVSEQRPEDAHDDHSALAPIICSHDRRQQQQQLTVVDVRLGTPAIISCQLASTTYGDIEFGFYPDVAPKTVAHIMKLVRLGAYNTNHFFRVDKGGPGCGRLSPRASLPACCA